MGPCTPPERPAPGWPPTPGASSRARRSTSSVRASSTAPTFFLPSRVPRSQSRLRPLDRADALARLARRYLRGHGPATARDLAKWAGLTLGDAQLAFAGARGDLVDRPGGLVDLADRARPFRTLSPRLLGPFDAATVSARRTDAADAVRFLERRDPVEVVFAG